MASTDQRPRKGTLLLLAGSLVTQACALVRYIVLARFLGPEQLGLAATLILTAQFFDSVSDSGSDRFLIQDRHGGEPRVQGLVQLLGVARGLTIATLLLLFAGSIAAFYREPQLAAGLRGLAIAPLVMGLLHYDVRRTQREHDFTREGQVMVAAEVAATIVTIVAAIATHSYLAALYGLLARAAVMVAVSHLTAEQRYTLIYAREHAGRLAAFGLPLMANGLFLFVAGQGDRLIVGNQLGVRDLGLYSAVMLLILYPSTTLLRYFHTVQMPMVAASRFSSPMFARSIKTMAGDATLLALGMAAGFAIVGPIAMPLLFGSTYAQPTLIVALVGVVQLIRFVHVWPTTAALALGRSGVVFASNALRLIAVPGALAGVWLFGGLLGLVLGFALGEYLAIVIAVAMSNRALGMPVLLNLDRLAAIGTGFAAICATAWLVDRGGTAMIAVAVAGTAALLGSILWRERESLFRLIAMLAQFGATIRARALR